MLRTVPLSLLGLCVVVAGCRDDACRDARCVAGLDATQVQRRDGAQFLDALPLDVVPLDVANGFDAAPIDATEGPDGGAADGGPGGSIVVVRPGASGRYVIRASAVLSFTAGRVFSPGEVRIEGNRIRCVGEPGACAQEGATELDTSGVVLPGLVDAHNHVAYDWLPEWRPGRLFNDSPSWRSDPEYDRFVAPYDQNKGNRESLCAMVQWGELRGLVNGTTTIYGNPTPRTCFRGLIRNAELSTGYNGFTADRVRSNALGIDTVNMADAQALIAEMNAGRVGAYMIHVAEGFTGRSFNEFADLRALGLLRPETSLIHACALAPGDFDEVAASGARLVWSPSSNVALYGRTTEIRAALEAGVPVALSPDWTLSGKAEVLGELRFARAWLDANEPGLVSDAALASMATLEAARALAADGEVGRLEAGLLADLLIVARAPGQEPHAAVVNARPRDLQLVFVDGVPVYGDPDVLRVLPGTATRCDRLDACGVPRDLCFDGLADGPSSVGAVQTALSALGPGLPLGLFDCATP